MTHMGAGIFLGGRPSSSAWDPSQLGASLLGMWDAERADLLTLSGSNVTSWADTVSGLLASQAISGSKPVYATTSFNGRPGIQFDGTDDFLVTPSQPFPTGATFCEAWILVNQQAQTPGDTTGRTLLSFGGTATGSQRRIERGVVSGVSRAYVRDSSTAVVNATVDFTGIHLVRGEYQPTQAINTTDGQGRITGATTPVAGALKATIGSTSNTTPTAFAQCNVNLVAITQPLTDDQATQFTAYLKSRGGFS